MIAMVNATHQESQRLLAMVPQHSIPSLHKLLEPGKTLFAELSECGFSLTGISVGGKPRVTFDSNPNVTADSAFRTMAPLLGEFRVVVFVDEAQNTPIGNITVDIIDCLVIREGFRWWLRFSA